MSGSSHEFRVLRRRRRRFMIAIKTVNGGPLMYSGETDELAMQAMGSMSLRPIATRDAHVCLGAGCWRQHDRG
jgi:hypothetical protein